MEFYILLRFVSTQRRCFNSQRDGILQMRYRNARALIRSFNSQRDGILPRSRNNSTSFIQFQFPTGWNSTMLPRKHYVPRHRVSIPNGMEFYRISACILLDNSSFQFPTGWNSTKPDDLGCVEIELFQFPTGWNSTSVGFLRWFCS